MDTACQTFSYLPWTNRSQRALSLWKVQIFPSLTNPGIQIQNSKCGINSHPVFSNRYLFQSTPPTRYTTVKQSNLLHERMALADVIDCPWHYNKVTLLVSWCVVLVDGEALHDNENPATRQPASTSFRWWETSRTSIGRRPNEIEAIREMNTS